MLNQLVDQQVEPEKIWVGRGGPSAGFRIYSKNINILKENVVELKPVIVLFYITIFEIAQN